MKKICILFLLAAFMLSVCASSFAASSNDAKDKIAKLEKEIIILKAKLVKIKSKIQKARIEKIIAGHKKVIAELKKELTSAAVEKPEKVEMIAAKVVPERPRILAIKGGLAGGAGLIAADFTMPVGPIYLGAEAGYAIGNNFGILDAGIKGIYSFGKPFIGLEISYAGYSKDVKDVPGLSGTIKSGVGVGIIGGTIMGPIQFGIGYNTTLGVRADAGYRIYL